jgi:inosine-uridine nucleoside N-ribohydrolase
VLATNVHLDTDLGGDIDDFCALAMLLRLPGVEITAVTTAAEEKGRRAGYVRRVLAIEGREEIPVAAGADAPRKLVYPDEEIYWGNWVTPAPNSIDKALSLLKQSIQQAAVVVGIGPFTNLCLLEKQYPGILLTAELCLMGGSIYPPRKGFPQWGYDMDYNLQADVQSARYVIERSNPTLVPLSVTVETALRRTHLEALSRAGALGQLLARQAESFAKDENMQEKFGETCRKLPSDIINFQHDALAGAIAVGWNEGVEISHLPLRIELRDGLLHEIIDPAARLLQVITKIDGNRFSEFWVDTVAGGWE